MIRDPLQRFETLKAPSFLDPTKKLDKRPPIIIPEMILLNAPITITNNKGNKGSPFLKPQELLKKFIGVLFTNIKTHTEEIQRAIKLHQFSQNRISSAYTTKILN
jgi:hypothetical protein